MSELSPPGKMWVVIYPVRREAPSAASIEVWLATEDLTEEPDPVKIHAEFHDLIGDKLKAAESTDGAEGQVWTPEVFYVPRCEPRTSESLPGVRVFFVARFEHSPHR
jgi:hypothetical protein